MYSFLTDVNNYNDFNALNRINSYTFYAILRFQHNTIIQ